MRVYWYVFRPHTTGVKCVIEHDGNWLMIRNTYGHRYWTFPGGRVHRHERPEDGARREVREEVGITLESLQPMGTYQNDRQYKRDTVHCFYAVVPTREHEIDGREIAEAKWFSLDAIPDHRGRAVEHALRWTGKVADT